MNLDGKKQIHEAAQSGDLTLVREILCLGDTGGSQLGNVNSLKRGDWTPVMMAAAKGHLEVTELLVNSGANLLMRNRDGWSVLHIACRQGSLELVSFLVQKCPELCTIRSKNGRSCLHIAALHGYTDIANHLLNSNWPLGPDCQDNCGTTPLMDAIRAGHIETAEALLLGGASLGIRDGLGRSVVHIAAQANSIVSLEFLASEKRTKVDFDSKASDGSTPLMLAAREGHVVAVRWLVEKGGVSIGATDNHGRTAFDHAVIAKRQEVAGILTSRT